MSTPPPSPAAQAVLDAAGQVPVPHGLAFPLIRLEIAAAIRALVEQVARRDRTDMPYITPADILDIAAELDGGAPQPASTETTND